MREKTCKSEAVLGRPFVFKPRAGRNLRKQLIIQQETEGSAFKVNVARAAVS